MPETPDRLIHYSDRDEGAFPVRFYFGAGGLLASFDVEE